MSAPHLEHTVPAELAHLIATNEPPKLDTFTGRLEYVRNLTGLSRVKYAEKIGVGSTTYDAWSRGTMPRGQELLDVCVAVERAFQVPRGWLAWGSDTKQSPLYLMEIGQGYGDTHRFGAPECN